MILKELEIKNIRSFKEAKVSFTKSNFVTGVNKDTEDGNGVGKTTLIEALKVSLYGSKGSGVNLKKLIRSGAKQGEIKAIWEVDEDQIEVSRIIKKKGSSELKVKINGKDPECETATDYQNEILEYIDSLDDFKKFRLIDKSKGINVLDFTPTQLSKTLMALCQDKFDGMRKKLLDKKNHFEKYHKRAVISPHAPSENRLSVLEMAIIDFDSEKLKKIKESISKRQSEKNKLLSQRGKIKQNKEQANKTIGRLKKMKTCWCCFQEVSEKHAKEQIKEFDKKIKKSDEELKELIKEVEVIDGVIKTKEKTKDRLYKRKEKLQSLKQRLETRLSQKDYKYTDEDVELMKKAVEEIDKFANFYIIEWVKIVEPIVNNYINQLGMVIHFTPNKKGNLNVSIERNGEKLDYDQLSNGERLFISFTFKIALLMEQGKSGIMISDEGFEALSTENLERAIQVIQDLPVQLIFVSHNPNVDVANTNTIFIEKEKGVSTV